MVFDEFAGKNFVRADCLDLSQLELDRSSRADSYAFALRIRISSCYPHPIGIGIIGATRGC